MDLPAVLEVDRVSKMFAQPGTGHIQVLERVCFSVAPGETCAVVGQSGSGKTTLLSLIAGLDRPDQGRIILAGQDLADLGQDRLARYRGARIGMVFQQFHLMPHLTARENICLALEILGQNRHMDEIQDRTDEMLVQVGLWNRRDHLPGQLSGGECQRVAIGRALVVRPALLLADEPTGNLDAATGERVAGLLFDLVTKEQKSMVLVTHNPDLAARCSRVCRLENGALA